MELGLIFLWSGAIIDIPAGFQLCDGTNGTPDLRNQFVVGSGDTYAPDDTGGAINHTHDVTGDGHVHDIGFGLDITAGAALSSTTDSTQITATTDLSNNLPPFYSLAYIQRV